MQNNIFNIDFQDFIEALNSADVKYILVGGYSVILHGYSRTTGDLDIWVEKTEDNYKAILIAFRRFGMPVFDMTLSNFIDNNNLNVFTFGRPPVAIDVITHVDGLEFNNAYQKAIDYEVDNQSKTKVKLIHLQDLINTKKATGRARDFNDIENLSE